MSNRLYIEHPRVAPQPEDDDAVHYRKHIFEVVADNHYRQALGAQVHDQVEHLARLGDPKGRGRLVKDHQLGVPHHRACHCHRLALPAR